MCYVMPVAALLSQSGRKLSYPSCQSQTYTENARGKRETAKAGNEMQTLCFSLVFAGNGGTAARVE